MGMKKGIFKILARLNKKVLPRYSKRDINKLSKIDKAIIAYRYWITVTHLTNYQRASSNSFIAFKIGFQPSPPL